jgi:hypothetical protein
LLLSGLVWAGALLLLWRRRAWRYGLLGFTVLVFIFCLLPVRPVNADRLRGRYVAALRRYEGATYWWGVENRVGIDCSGLVRKGLVVADIEHGILTLNGGLVRRGLVLWWHDCSARAMRDEYREQTRLVFKADSINQLNHSKVLPGDIAVTSSGVHVLAYLGDRKWIQANPSAGEVITVESPNTETSYYNIDVHVMRWRQFE